MSPPQDPGPKGADQIPWDLFFELVELSQDQQSERLSEIRLEDPASAQALHELLVAHQSSDPLLDEPAALVNDELEEDRQEPVPTTPVSDGLPFAKLGEFEMVSRLGAGGMGEVFLGHRTIDGSQQRVAIKLVRLSEGGSEAWSEKTEADLRERFLKERAVLARLDHPGIARLIDYGTAPDGRPYLVLEFVDGLPIDEACRTRELNLEQRLELFAQVCETVHAAHRNLVVHRDIKPSNVLVSDRPRLVDFGIAKDLSESDLTRTAHRRLTPSHASPEQLRGDLITTASDIYSLGVLLCQLVTERLPYSDTGTDSRPVGAVANAILAGASVRPSQLVTAVAKTGQQSEDFGLEGKTEALPPPFPASQLKGDIDAIVLRALALEPSRRYDSAMALATDVRNKLANRPITARPDSFLYRASKLIERRPLTFGLGAAAVVLLIAAVGLLAVQQVELRASLLRADTERELAIQQSERADLTNRMLLGLIQEASPERSLGEPITVLEALERGSDRLFQGEGQDPVDRARLQLSLIRIYSNLGRRTKANALIEEAIQDLNQLQGFSSAELQSVQDLIEMERGRNHYDQGDFDRALSIYDGVLERELSENPLEAATQAQLLVSKATALFAAGRQAEAESLLKATIEELEDPDLLLRIGDLKRHRLLSEAQARLGRLLANRDQFDSALTLQTEALETMRRAFGPTDPKTLDVQYERALTLERQGQIEAATIAYRDAFAKQTSVLGAKHPTTLNIQGRLAAALQRIDKFAEAEQLYVAALEQLAPDSPRRATQLINLGWVLHEQGKFSAASTNYTTAEQQLLAAAAPEYQFITVLNNRGLLAIDQANYAEARVLLDRSLEIAERLYGKDHSVVAFPLANLARVELELSNLEQAETLHRRALTIRREALGNEHPDLSHSLLGLARTLCATGQTVETLAERTAEGRELALEALRVRARAQSNYKAALARVEVAACDMAGAEDSSKQAKSMLEEALPPVLAVRGQNDASVKRIRKLLLSAP